MESSRRNRTDLRANSPRPATILSPVTGVKEIKGSYYFRKDWKRLMSSFLAMLHVPSLIPEMENHFEYPPKVRNLCPNLTLGLQSYGSEL